jgi:hypothetical protein
MFDFRNGKPLMDFLVPEGLSHAATSFVESLKINSITEKVRRDRRVVITPECSRRTCRRFDQLLLPRSRSSDSLPERRWLSFAICFLHAYNDAAVIRELKKRLVVPTGLALVWWNVRTNFTASAKVKRRFRALRRAIGKLELYRSLAIDSTRKRRRPSISCQRTRPGMPTIKSRKRASKDMAKAVSPGIPRRLPTTR